MAATPQQRRTDLCTCGKPRVHPVHATHLPSNPADRHEFVPHPQPPTPPVARVEHISRISAWRVDGVWHAHVEEVGRIGGGLAQDSTWLGAINAAVEDLKEKTKS